MKLLRNKAFQLIGIILLSWFVIKPLIAAGFFPMHDDTQVARVFEMGKSLKEGQFPVRIVNGLGYDYGYPIFNFYAPLPYYFGGLIAALGVDALLATKAMIGMGAVLAGVSMYILGMEFFGVGGGILAALLYLYAPYHAVQIFVRGSVGELWAYGLLPFIVWSFYQTARLKSKRWIVLSALCLAAIILSHNIIGILTVIGIIVGLGGYLGLQFFQKKKQFTIQYSTLSTLLALGLSAFFWLPALIELPLTNATRLATQVNFRDHFVYLDQLWSSPWGFAGSAAGRLDGMSFMVGKLHILLGIIGILGYLSNRQKNKNKLPIIITIVLFTLISIFMMLPNSAPIWELIQPLHFIQFPWRLLVFVVFGLSLVAGGIGLIGRPGYLRNLCIAGIGILVVVFNTKYFKPQEVIMRFVSDYTNHEIVRWETSKISDEYLPKDFANPGRNYPYLSFLSSSNQRGGIIREYQNKASEIRFKVEAVEEDEIVIHKAYFPGWRVLVSGKKQDIELYYGLISFQVPHGTSDVVVQFANTPIRTIGNCITLISFGIVGFLFYEKRKKIS